MSNPLKVLTIVYDLGIGGTQRAAQNFASAYKAYGMDSRVLPVYAGGVRQEELQKAGVEVYPYWNDYRESVEIIKTWSPNIIHIHRSGEHDPVLTVILKALKNKANRVVETNVFSLVDNTKDAGLTDIHFQLSKWCLWKWQLFLKRKSLGIVLPYLVMTESFFRDTEENILKTKKELNLPLNKFIFGRVGQKSPAKFNWAIVKAFDELFSKNPKTHFLLVGLPDEFLNQTHQLTSYKRGGITLIDSVKGDQNLRLVYNVMDCFLHFSSIGESFGMVLAEAQLCEVPVLSVATPKADNSQMEVLVHNKTSMVVKDKRFLPEVMEQFVSAKYPLREYGIKGRMHILDNFTPNVLIPKLTRIFQIILEKESPEEIIKNEFLTNLSTLPVNQLAKEGYGEYSASTQVFLKAPRVYLLLSERYRKMKMLISGRGP